MVAPRSGLNRRTIHRFGFEPNRPPSRIAIYVKQFVLVSTAGLSGFKNAKSIFWIWRQQKSWRVLAMVAVLLRGWGGSVLRCEGKVDRAVMWSQAL